MPSGSQYQKLRALILKRAGGRELTARDYNFADYTGKTLLHHACQAGDMDEVMALCAKGADINVLSGNGRTPLEIALISGHITIATYLFERGGKIYRLPIVSCVESGRAWLKEQYHALIKTMIAGRSEADDIPAPLNQLLHEGSCKLLDRVAEIYDGAEHGEYVSGLIPKVREPQIVSSFIAAIRSGQNDYIERALRYRRCKADDSFGEKSFSFAVCAGKFDIADLFRRQGININSSDNFRHNILLKCAENKYKAGVQYALDAKVNLLTSDIYGNNILHFIFEWGDLDLIGSIRAALGETNYQKLVQQKNIYDITPDDIQVKHISREPSTQKFRQEFLIHNIRYYLLLKDRDLELFSSDGYCFGLTGLFQIYALRGRSDYFFSTISLLASWDGDSDALDDPLAETLPQSRYYTTLGECLERWIHDMTWFQHYAEPLTRASGLSQINGAKSLLSVVNDEEVDHRRISYFDITMFFFCRERTGLANYLEEYLNFFLRLPPGLFLKICFNGHVVGLYRKSEGITLFYDSNLDYALESNYSSVALSHLIQDVLCVALKETIGDAVFELWAPGNSAFSCTMADFELFPLEELPSAPRKSKVCHFTRLHSAVIFGSVRNVKQLLSDGHCDINAHDIFSKTALDYAIKSGNDELITLLLDNGAALDCLERWRELKEYCRFDLFKYVVKKYGRQSLTMRAVVEGCSVTEVENLIREGIIDLHQQAPNGSSYLQVAATHYTYADTFKLLLAMGANPLDEDIAGKMKPLFKVIVTSIDNAFSNRILDIMLQHLETPNAKDKSGKTLLHYACLEIRETEIKILVENGADFTIKDDAGKTPLHYMSGWMFMPCILKMILAAKPTLSKSGASILLAAAIEVGSLKWLKEVVALYPGCICDLIEQRDCTPLLVAVDCYNLAAVSLLLEKGADQNIKGTIQSEQNTPFHHVLLNIEQYDKAYIDLFLQYDPDFDSTNNKGQTLRDVLEEKYPAYTQRALGM